MNIAFIDLSVKTVNCISLKCDVPLNIV